MTVRPAEGVSRLMLSSTARRLDRVGAGHLRRPAVGPVLVAGRRMPARPLSVETSTPAITPPPSAAVPEIVTSFARVKRADRH